MTVRYYERRKGIVKDRGHPAPGGCPAFVKDTEETPTAKKTFQALKDEYDEWAEGILSVETLRRLNGNEVQCNVM